MEETLKQILSALKDMRVDINELKQGQKSLKVGIENLENGQKRVEVGLHSLQGDLVESLGLYTEKIVQHVDDKTEVLNKRVYKVESEIERLSRQ